MPEKKEEEPARCSLDPKQLEQRLAATEIAEDIEAQAPHEQEQGQEEDVEKEGSNSNEPTQDQKAKDKEKYRAGVGAVSMGIPAAKKDTSSDDKKKDSVTEIGMGVAANIEDAKAKKEALLDPLKDTITRYISDGQLSAQDDPQGNSNSDAQPTVLRRGNPRHLAAPGAVAVAPNRASSVDPDDEDVESLSSGGSSSVSQEETGLLQARQVTDDSGRLDLQEAQPIDPDSRPKPESSNQGICVFAIAAFCVIALGVGLGVGLSRRNSDTLPVQEPTQTPTTTVAPTPTPKGPLDELRKRLPNYTLQSLESFSPQYKAWQWLLEHPKINSYPEWKKTQLFALATFFYAFEGENWYPPIRERWMDYEKDECYWFTSGYGFINKTDLTYNEWAEDGYEIVDPCNQTTGEFVSIYVGDMNLTGLSPSLPPEIELLTSLNNIDLSQHGFRVPFEEFLPEQFYQMNNTMDLVLFGNQLSGTIPTELGLVSNLLSVGLVGNALEGTMPTELAMLDKALVLTVYGNEITGTLPTEYGLMTNLEYAYFGGNLFSGTIPSEYGNIESLKQLDVSNNPLLTGTIPSELTTLEGMGFLRVQATGITGVIPEGLCEFQSPNCTYEVWYTPTAACYLSFDCSDLLCGCDCPCSNSTTLEEPLADETSSRI